MRGAQDALGTVGIENDHARRAAVLDEEVGGEPTLVHLGPRLLHRDRQRPFDLGPGRIAARVDDPRHRVPSLAREREGSVDDVEVGAERHELAHAIRAFGREHAHRVGVVEPATRGERVRPVQLGRVVVLDQGRGHATLRVAGGRPTELALGEDLHREAGGACPDRSREARSAAAEDEDVSHG